MQGPVGLQILLNHKVTVNGSDLFYFFFLIYLRMQLLEQLCEIIYAVL